MTLSVNIAQYVGRLHRIHDRKKEVQVYDYADLNVPMLERMFNRRCRGYEAVGYRILLPASAIPGWPVEVPLPVDPLWKADSNAGAKYFEDRCCLSQLDKIDWSAVQTLDWRGSQKKEGKQAEFLMEYCFPWELVERIGIHSGEIYQQVANAFTQDCHRPVIDIKSEWYY